MTNPFGTDAMAAGYAAARPPVHARVLADYFGTSLAAPPVRRALDLGCGAGLSTHALEPFAEERIGIEPAVPMLRWTREVAPGARFAAAAAEALPLPDRFVDLITAAGSLNYVADLPRALTEARRVLTKAGRVLVYDFSAGRRFGDGAGLEAWFAAFLARYPYPSSEARPLNPAILAEVARAWTLRRSEPTRIPLTMSLDRYIDYVLTETNVAAAVRRGTSLEAIGGWVSETLPPVWGGVERAVLFEGYWAELV